MNYTKEGQNRAGLASFMDKVRISSVKFGEKIKKYSSKSYNDRIRDASRSQSMVFTMSYSEFGVEGSESRVSQLSVLERCLVAREARMRRRSSVGNSY